ncbi:MAG: hypothetical protein KME28_05215 [Pelatocladus maniniholoensis HA4357-MV3]|jgi:RNA-directed DNA polymerase|uniref:Reverse transcriptase domain-containing protein n=1 Tax=Pelatocladus maniniholoensis HA4357-MV3 TaxID=1117104 RepID=A0A9E3H6U9_9NOST|nr:hypothetical protein [Pelatocladus maniniholoensis HA4357-MV3]
MSLNVIRYAYDFVVLHHDIEVIRRSQDYVNQWLSNIGPELKPEKTNLTHTFKHFEGKVGFNFLGFLIRQYSQGKRESSKDFKRKTLGFKTLIKPTPESVKRNYARITKLVDQHKSSTQEGLIKTLNPIIRGWANYYRTVVSAEIFNKLAASSL